MRVTSDREGGADGLLAVCLRSGSVCGGLIGFRHSNSSSFFLVARRRIWDCHVLRFDTAMLYRSPD